MPPVLTHFLCVPLAGVQLARTLASFKADATNPATFDVPPEAVRPLGTLHLTLGVMSLKDDSLDRAVALLKAMRPRDVLARVRALGAATTTATTTKATAEEEEEEKEKEESLSITLRGLHPMQLPSKTSVLYAPPVDEDGILYRFCEQIKQAFTETGLMAEENRPLLLHATVVNTIYVKGGGRQRQQAGGGGGGGGGKRNKKERLTLDARDMLSHYEEYTWIEEMPVARLAICKMGAKKVEGEDEERYEVEAEVEF